MKYFNLIAIILIFIVSAMVVLAVPFIEVVPLDYDFGDVQVGSSSTAMITISNLDGTDLEIYSVTLQGSPDFAITMYPDPVVGSGMSTYVEVTFTPSTTGYVSANLDIESNDMGNPLVTVSLAGMGVGQEQPPASVADILDFFDSSTADGSLVGSGPGKSAEKRLNALRNMIEAAGDLIDGGFINEACQQLLVAYKKTDGLPRPPDFVAGPAAPTLAGMILDLRAGLGC